MLPNKSGSIINTASVLGLGALPRKGHYIATKHGVVGLTKAAAVEYAFVNGATFLVDGGVIAHA